jgi:hypothetical protein
VRIVAAIAAAALLAAPMSRAADAIDPERLAEARAVLKAMEIEKQLDQLLAVMSQELTKVVINAGGPAGKDPRVAQVVVTEALAMSRENSVRPGGLLDLVAELYAEKLSLEDLRAIRAFHESPAARHLQQATPDLMQKIIQRSMVVNRETLPGLCARVKQRLQRENFKEAESFGCPAVWS